MSSKNPRKNSSDSVGGINLIGNGKYPLVPLSAIQIVERPKDGEEDGKLFYNPRGLSSFTPERMQQLQISIRSDGLQQPPIVRAIMDGDSITSIELIAGERRIRSCRAIYDNDLSCFDEDAEKPDHFDSGDTIICRGRFGTVHKQIDESVIVDFEEDHIGSKERKKCSYDDVYSAVSGEELYEHVPCKVIYDCTDQRALRLAFTENDQSEPLTISEEIALVERLERSGLKQDEIAVLIGSNVTWVSQTSNFREQLPEEAFEKLLNGNMTRHVAVNFLSYAPEMREELYEAAVAAEVEETAEKIKLHQEQKVRLEDEEDIHMMEAKKAEKHGDKKSAAVSLRKATTAASKADKAAERLERAKREKGTIKQGHVKKGANAKGLQPKKAKSMDENDIAAAFVEGMMPYLEGEGVCDLTGEFVPAEYAAIVRRTALAIIERNRDPLHPIREYMIEMGHWQVAENDDQEETIEEEDDETMMVKSTSKRGRKKKTSDDAFDNEATDIDMDFDDEEPSDDELQDAVEWTEDEDFDDE